MKILLVDDSMSETLVISQYIRRIGGISVSARTGVEAVEAFTREQPDMVLLDVVLPDFDGHEVARRIRAVETSGNWTPIIFVTAMTRDEDVEKGIAAGGDDYIYTVSYTHLDVYKRQSQCWRSGSPCGQCADSAGFPESTTPPAFSDFLPCRRRAPLLRH